MTTPARAYFSSRAISPQVAFDCGVRPGANANELAFPNGRRRVLDSSAGPRAGRMLQAKGSPLAPWWLNAADGWSTALVCEGESDSLAARSALVNAPESSGMSELPIICVPGTGMPVDRLYGTLAQEGIKEALLALDPDEAGERYAAEAAERLLTVLDDADIRPVRVEVPEPDLAGWLATVEEGDRGERLASLLIDSELAAPSKAELYRRREIEGHKQAIAKLEAA